MPVPIQLQFWKCNPRAHWPSPLLRTCSLPVWENQFPQDLNYVFSGSILLLIVKSFLCCFQGSIQLRCPCIIFYSFSQSCTHELAFLLWWSSYLNNRTQWKTRDKAKASLEWPSGRESRHGQLFFWINLTQTLRRSSSIANCFTNVYPAETSNSKPRNIKKSYPWLWWRWNYFCPLRICDYLL